MSIMEIAYWNYARNGLKFDPQLEEQMLLEEEAEFKDALVDYMDAMKYPTLFSEDEVVDAMVDLIDAYCDYNFVSYGTALKRMGSTTELQTEHARSLMYTVLTELLVTHGVDMFRGLKIPFIERCMSIVIEANKAKPLDKTSGKVVKGDNWVDPKESIRELLLAEGFEADLAKANERLKDLVKANTKLQPLQLEDLKGADADEK